MRALGPSTPAWFRHVVVGLLALPLLLTGCGDPEPVAASSPSDKGEASLRNYPVAEVCPDASDDPHHNQRGPIHVPAGSIALGHEASTPDELRDKSDAVVEGPVSRLSTGRSNEYWGYVNIHISVEQNLSKRPAPESLVFEHIICENPSGRRVVTENQLDDIRVGDRLRVYVRGRRLEGAQRYAITNGIGLFRIVDGRVEKTNRRDSLIRQIEGRPEQDEEA